MQLRLDQDDAVEELLHNLLLVALVLRANLLLLDLRILVDGCLYGLRVARVLYRQDNAVMKVSVGIRVSVREHG